MRRCGITAALRRSFMISFYEYAHAEISAIEAMRLIRTFDSDKAQAIPIIAMTTNVFKDDSDKPI